MSSKGLTLLGLAEKILREEKRPLSPQEIWDLAREKDYAGLVDSQG